MGEEDRWSTVLRQVDEAHETGQPWYRRFGIFWAWAAGIGFGMALVTLLLLLIADLFTPGPLFSAYNASNWLFWAFALLLFGGLFAPSATDMARSAQERQTWKERHVTKSAETSASRYAQIGRIASGAEKAEPEAPKPEPEEEPEPADDRRINAVRRRLMRVYNPWRWRLWGASFFCLLLSVVLGLLVQPAAG